MNNIFNSERINWESYYRQGYQVGNTEGLNCPYCNAFSSLEWSYGLGDSFINQAVYKDEIVFTIVRAKCLACNQASYWIKSVDDEIIPEQLIYPKKKNETPPPNSDMPSDIKQIYNEAGLVIGDSPRASAALSRLAIDKLTTQLEPKGKNLNIRIGNLVEKGLPPTIQQSLDIVRVVGNNAIHPGEIDITDNKEIALSLLELLNIIVDNQISQPKRIQEMFENLPQGAREAIDKRDNR
ncbi:MULTISPECIES: DUF4145 domain-containing protein [Enterococcus]|uniref:DUF4145 domain-containing protein n=1 Tax=Enterococcus TaxID=1350 RepID=UPI0034A2C4A1